MLHNVLFSRKRSVFHNFIFFCSNNTFFINYALKCKYYPRIINVMRDQTSHHISSLNILQTKIMSQKFSSELPQFRSLCTLTEIHLSQNLQIFMILILFDSFSILTLSKYTTGWIFRPRMSHWKKFPSITTLFNDSTLSITFKTLNMITQLKRK
jgi:hypothetical protein